MVWLWQCCKCGASFQVHGGPPMPKHHHLNLARRRGGGVGGKRNLWERGHCVIFVHIHVMIQLYRLYSLIYSTSWPWLTLMKIENHWIIDQVVRTGGRVHEMAAGKELSLPFWSQHANVLSKCLDFWIKRNQEPWMNMNAVCLSFALVSFSERSQGGSGKWSENSQSGGKWGANSSSGNKWSAWSTNSKSGGSGKWKANSTSGKSYSNTGWWGEWAEIWIQDFDSAKLAKYILKTFQGM